MHLYEKKFPIAYVVWIGETKWSSQRGLQYLYWWWNGKKHYHILENQNSLDRHKFRNLSAWNPLDRFSMQWLVLLMFFLERPQWKDFCFLGELCGSGSNKHFGCDRNHGRWADAFLFDVSSSLYFAIFLSKLHNSCPGAARKVTSLASSRGDLSYRRCRLCRHQFPPNSKRY